MAHERHANFLQNAGLHQAGVERVAEIMKTEVAESCITQRRVPSGFDDANRLVPEADDDPLLLAFLRQ